MKAHHGLVTSRGAPIRVLVVEDVVDLRDFYQILLREEGYEVACASDGSDALGRLAWDPDVVLLDLMMPVMDGYEFYARLRELRRDRPAVIVLSAVTPRTHDLPGVAALLPKPFDFPQLLHRIEAAVAHASLN